MAATRPAQAFRPFELSLRVRHPLMDPAEISTGLGIEPIHAFRAGQPKSSRGQLSNPVAAHAVHAESYWLGSLELLSRRSVQEWSRAYGDLGESLSLILTVFARAHEQFLRRIQSEGGQVTLLVAVTGPLGGFSITHSMSQMLDRTGIAVEFEFAGG
jgi:hypothetical protein